MNAQFFKFDGDPKILDKTFSESTNIVLIKPYQPVSDLRGFIVVSDDFENYNYCKIEIAGRWKSFFISGRSIDTAGRLTLSLDIDVLETFKNEIKKLPVVVGRNQLFKATEMFDPQLRTLQRTAAFVKIIGRFSYDASQKILVTVG